MCDPAVLVVAWTRVRGNKGKRSAGVDGLRPDAVFSTEEGFLPRARDDLKAPAFTPLPVREWMIPKPGSSKRRRLGIPTARDRTVQAALKLVLEPLFEACFDDIDHPALVGRVRRRVGDKRVLSVVKAFLHAGILGEDGVMRNTATGTPQGGILSPLLANVALSVLDDGLAPDGRAGDAGFDRLIELRAPAEPVPVATSTFWAAVPADEQ